MEPSPVREGRPRPPARRQGVALLGLLACGLLGGSLLAACRRSGDGNPGVTSRVIWRWPGQAGQGGPLALSPDGAVLYVGDGNDLVALPVRPPLAPRKGAPAVAQVPKPSFRVSLGKTPVTALMVSPTRAGHLVHACAGALVTVDPAGKTVWRQESVNPCQGLVYHPDGQVLVSTAGAIVALAQMGGAPAWRYALRAKGPSEMAVAADGTVYAVTGGELRALLPGGTLRWLLGRENLARPLALAQDGSVHVGSWNGSLMQISPEGKVIGRLRTTGTPMPVIGAGNALVAVDDSGQVYRPQPGAIGPDGGPVSWKQSTEANVYSAPAIDREGVVYVRTRVGTLWAVGPDGKVRWQESVGMALQDILLAPDGTLFLTTTDPSVVAVQTGAPAAPAGKAPPKPVLPAWSMAGGGPQRLGSLPLDPVARAANVPERKLTAEAKALDGFLKQAGGGLGREGVVEDLTGSLAGGFQRVLVARSVAEERFALVLVLPGQGAGMITAKLPKPALPIAKEVTLEFKDLDGDGTNEVLARTTSIKETEKEVETAVDLCILKLAGDKLTPILEQPVALKRVSREDKARIDLEVRLDLLPRPTRGAYDLELKQAEAKVPAGDKRADTLTAAIGRYRLQEGRYQRLEAAAATGGAP